MTAVAGIQLAIASVCGILAALHFVLWRILREDRIQLYLAITLSTAALLSLALVTTAKETLGLLGAPEVWLWIAMAVNLPAWISILLMVFAFAEVPVTGLRRAALGAVVVIWLGILASHIAVSVRHLEVKTLAQMMEHMLPGVQPAIGMLLPGAALVEGALVLRKGRMLEGAILVGVGVATGAILTVFLLVWPEQPWLLGLTGVPLVVAASGTMLVRYRNHFVRRTGEGRYELVRRLAAGGMGELYLATRRGAGGFRREVVLKRVLSDGTGSLDRLLGEARMAASLVHPNIVAVHDVGWLDTAVDGQPFGWYIGMEMVRGVDLARLRAAARPRAPIPAAFAVAVAEQVCGGLAHAHARDIMHRDISPQNIVISYAGEVKIIDFGIAIERERLAEEPAGQIVGKLGYFAPEYLEGQPFTPQADVYAVGAVLFELLADVPPFPGSNFMEVLTAMLAGKAPRLRERRPEISEALEAVVARALERDPAHRFATADELAQALAGIRTDFDLGAYVRELCPDEAAERAPVRSDAVTGHVPTRDATPTTPL